MEGTKGSCRKVERIENGVWSVTGEDDEPRDSALMIHANTIAHVFASRVYGVAIRVLTFEITLLCRLY